jgi:hypothetical protein
MLCPSNFCPFSLSLSRNNGHRGKCCHLPGEILNLTAEAGDRARMKVSGASSCLSCTPLLILQQIQRLFVVVHHVCFLIVFSRTIHFTSEQTARNLHLCNALAENTKQEGGMQHKEAIVHLLSWQT